jgi:hypothetical protein
MLHEGKRPLIPILKLLAEKWEARGRGSYYILCEIVNVDANGTKLRRGGCRWRPAGGSWQFRRLRSSEPRLREQSSILLTRAPATVPSGGGYPRSYSIRSSGDTIAVGLWLNEANRLLFRPHLTRKLGVVPSSLHSDESKDIMFSASTDSWIKSDARKSGVTKRTATVVWVSADLISPNHCEPATICSSDQLG